MIKVTNVYGIECIAWKVENDVQLFKELESEGFELEVKKTELEQEWLGTITIAKLPCPLLVGYWITKNDDGDLDYLCPSNFKKEYEPLMDGLGYLQEGYLK